MNVKSALLSTLLFLPALSSFALKKSVCPENYGDLIQGINAFQEEKFALTLKYASLNELANLESRYVKCFREMIENGSDVNYSDSTARTPAHLAAYFKLGSVLELLIEAGANLDKQEESGFSPRDIMEVRRTENKN